jgi:hypothetical protein
LKFREAARFLPALCGEAREKGTGEQFVFGRMSFYAGTRQCRCRGGIAVKPPNRAAPVCEMGRGNVNRPVNNPALKLPREVSERAPGFKPLRHE